MKRGRCGSVKAVSRSIAAPHRQQNCSFLAGRITRCAHGSPGHTHCTRAMERAPPAPGSAGIHARRARSPGHSWKAKPRGASPVGLRRRGLKIQTLLREHFPDVPGACPVPSHRIRQPKHTLPRGGTSPLSPAEPRHPRPQALSREKAGWENPCLLTALQLFKNRFRRSADRPRRLF